jgi:hypothetical protein
LEWNSVKNTHQLKKTMIAPKYSPKWDQKITTLIGKQIDHTFKKGEKKLEDFEFKGSVITAEAGETVKVNEAELLSAQRKKLVKELEGKKIELKKKSGYADTYAELSLQYDNLKERVDDWRTHLKTGLTSTTRNTGNYSKQ